MEEIWKDVVGYEGLYLVSNIGNISKPKGGEIIDYKKQSLRRNYLSVNLCNDNKSKTYYVHRIVALSFIQNPLNKKCVNHIDGNKLNNNVSNLEWVTYSENMMHSYKMGLSPKQLLGKFGKEHHSSKPIFQYSVDGKFINKFNGLREAERILGIRRAGILYCAHGKTNSYKNCIWRYHEIEK